MKASRIIRGIIASILIGCGVVWSIMFPKTSDLLRPDFVASVALGMGLIVTGALFLFLKRPTILVGVLLILLLWSALFNVCLLAQLRYVVVHIMEADQTIHVEAEPSTS